MLRSVSVLLARSAVKGIGRRPASAAGTKALQSSRSKAKPASSHAPAKPKARSAALPLAKHGGRGQSPKGGKSSSLHEPGDTRDGKDKAAGELELANSKKLNRRSRLDPLPSPTLNSESLRSLVCPSYMTPEREEEVLQFADRMQGRDLTGDVPVASFALEILKTHPSVINMGLRERMDFLSKRWSALSREKCMEYINNPLKGFL